MTPPEDDRLDELGHKIDDARQQAQDHGTIPDEDAPTPEYQPGDPVGLPESDPDGS